MLISQSILNQFCSNFVFYISGPILTKYIIQQYHTKSQSIPQLQISKSQQISTTSNSFISANSQQIWIHFGFYITKYMIPHQISTNPTTSNIKISTNSNAYISVNSPSILVTFWIQNLMTNPKRPSF